MANPRYSSGVLLLCLAAAHGTKLCGGTACAGEHMALNHEIMQASMNGMDDLLELALDRAAHEHASNWVIPGTIAALARKPEEKPMLAAESTSLHAAAYMGKFNAVRILLRHHFHTNQGNAEGVTPLMVAAGLGHEKIVAAMLKMDIHNLQTTDAEGRTPLEWAKTDRMKQILNGEVEVELPPEPKPKETKVAKYPDEVPDEL
eukprot:g2897.t1